jgi:hypothetical protein
MADMRSTLAVIATGLVSGAIGAVVVSHFQGASTSAPPTIPRINEDRKAIIVPPGWDPHLLSRVANLEQRVQDLRSTNTTELASSAEANDPAAMIAKREQERTEHYQHELAFRDQQLSDRAQEPVDSRWAYPQEQNMQSSLSSALGQSAQVKNIDCRDKTCTATLLFPTPTDALSTVRQHSNDLAVSGCNGFIAIPTPPMSSGPYDLTVLYTCR